jgi:HK97 family phage prohead protease
MTRTFERRVFPIRDAQIIRASDKTGSLAFRGRPWVYGQMSDDLGGWSELIDPGAATRTLAASPDVRFLVNHDSNLLLARTSSGTLRLSEDDDGGLAEADMANVSYARDLAELIDRGDLNQMSFGFWITSDSWSGNIHHVREFDLDGGDVSAVTFPAFPQTSAELRSAVARVVAGDQRDGRSREQFERDLEQANAAAIVITEGYNGLAKALRGVGMLSDDAARFAFPELREGKVLSASNRKLVQNARDALSELLDKTENSAPAPDAGYVRQRAADRLRSLEALASL